jgi:hypothetical protein
VQNGQAVGSGGGGGTAGNGGNGSSTGNGGPSGGGPSASNGASSSPSVDPLTGQVLSGGSGGGNPQAVYAQPVSVAGNSDQQITLATLTVLELLAAVTAPALVGIWLQRRRKRD